MTPTHFVLIHEGAKGIIDRNDNLIDSKLFLSLSETIKAILTGKL